MIEGDMATAAGHISYGTKVLLELAKLDFAGAVPESDDMADEDWSVAMLSFYQARVDHYTDADSGAIIFESHDDEGEPMGATQ